jgi:peptidyl-prolyl cis-trans isomerase C
VKAKSIDPQAKLDAPADLAGDVGFVTPPGDAKGKNPRVPEAVRAAAYEIGAIGEILPRVVVDGGKGYIIKLVQKAEAHERTFAEAERSIRIKLAQDQLKAQEEAALEKLKAEVPVVIDEAALARVKVPVTDAGLTLPPLPASSFVDGGHWH